MIEVKIDCLNLSIADAVGQEHRIRPIAERAAHLLADRLDTQPMDARGRRGATVLEDLRVAPITLNLVGTSNEQAAAVIAGALFDALALRLRK
ncbi:MAG TPA: hypothetical protein VFE42_09520, partial [Chloroflexota bacterium]|nr:hypothetical protein [Chloroflexota bacterium]